MAKPTEFATWDELHQAATREEDRQVKVGEDKQGKAIYKKVRIRGVSEETRAECEEKATTWTFNKKTHNRQPDKNEEAFAYYVGQKGWVAPPLPENDEEARKCLEKMGSVALQELITRMYQLGKLDPDDIEEAKND